MKLNKKLFSLLFVALLAIALVGCGGEEATTEAPASTETPTTEEAVDLEALIDALKITYADTLENENFEATDDLDLVSSYDGVDLTWTSSNTDYLANDGTITRPTYTQGDQTVTLTVTATDGTLTEDYAFFVTVKALPISDQEIADEVFLIVTAFPANPVWTSADELDLAASGDDKSGTSYDVTWTSSHPQYIALDGTITQPEGDNVDVTLTATITVNGNDFSKDKVFTVAKIAEGKELTTIAAVKTEEVDTYVEIQGVTYVGSIDGGYFFTDGTDLIYVYDSGLDLEVGDVVNLTGLVDEYFGYAQLSGSDTMPVKTETSTEAASTLVPEIKTIAEVEAEYAAEDGDMMLHDLVSVTGRVYYAENYGDPVYLVPADYDFENDYDPTQKPVGSAIEIYDYSNDTVLIPFHGDLVTIDLIPNGYHTGHRNDTAYFLGEAEDVQLSFENDVDAVEAALAVIEFPVSIIENTTLDLLETIYGVTISYVSDNATVFNATTGAVDVSSLTVQETITITATASRGDETDTATFEIKVGPLALSDISAAYDMLEGEHIKIQGILTAEIKGYEFYFQDLTAGISLDVYDLQDEFAAIALGSDIIITGIINVSNGLYELEVLEYDVQATTPALPTAADINGVEFTEEALEAYMSQMVAFTGFVLKDVPEVDSYGTYEFTIMNVVTEEEILVRIDNRSPGYDDVETEVLTLEPGDEVVITGAIIGWYYGPQILISEPEQFEKGTNGLTAQQSAELDANLMETEMTLTEDYVLPTEGLYGSTFSVVEIFGTASNFIDATTTTGTLDITRPYDTDVMATITFKATNGTAEVMFDVEVTISNMLMPQTPSELFISEYGEGSSNNKWLEIYNGTGADVDLADYTLEVYSNGAAGDSPTSSYVLSGTLVDGEVYVIANGDSTTDILDEADYEYSWPNVASWNGDDAIAIIKNDTVIDVIGVIGEDPGSSWVVGDGATGEYTLVRSQSTFAPNTTFTASEWDVYPQDTFDYIGSHTLVTGETTDAMIVNADLAALDLGGIIKTAGTVNLPTVGDNGSTIVWTKSEDTDANATMNTTNDAITFTDVPADTVEVVKLQAVVTSNDVSLTGVFVYKVEGFSDADRVAADKAEIVSEELGGDAYSGVSITLPTTVTNGSTVTWALTTDEDELATLTGLDLTIARAEGTASVVVLTATIENNLESDTLVVTYNMMPEITDLSLLHSMTAEEYDIATGTEVYVKGVVITNIREGLFIQDENGNAIFIDDVEATVGDEIIYSGTLAIINGVRALETVTQVSIESNGNALVYEVLTADEIVALTAADSGKLITYTGLVVKSFSDGWPYTATFEVQGTTNITLSMDQFNDSDINWVRDIYAIDDVMEEASFVFVDFGYSKNRIHIVDVATTEAQAIELDAANVPAELALYGDMDIPMGEFGSVYSVTNISSELTSYLVEDTGNPGTLLVTRPAIGESDVTGTMTIEVSNGTATVETKTVNVTVKAETNEVTETFDNLDLSGTSYSEGTFVGVELVEWTYTESRGDFTLDGKAIMLDKNGDGSSLSATIQGGIANFSVDFYDGYGGAAQVELWINGVLVDTSVSFDDDGDGSIYETFEVTGINVAGEFDIEILAAGSQMVLDNLTWTKYTAE